jgi:SAM-dependent methyltransferase
MPGLHNAVRLHVVGGTPARFGYVWAYCRRPGAGGSYLSSYPWWEIRDKCRSYSRVLVQGTLKDARGPAGARPPAAKRQHYYACSVQSDDDRARVRARQLAAEAVAAGDGTGWFEKLYEEAEAGVSPVPWADGLPNPHLLSWFSQDRERERGEGRSALVVGCGLGYDAEFLAGRGFMVTAFDVAPSAVAAAQRENPGSPVTYVTADLLNLPRAWAGAFDLVVEAYTVQPLYGPTRAAAIAALHVPVAPDGTLLVIARATNEEDPFRDPALMPWPLTRAEIDAIGAGILREVRVEQFLDEEDPPKLRWRAEFRGALRGNALLYASVSTRIREQ